jgi:hypothetical protein
VKAEAVKAEIEREAETPRNAIAAIVAGDGTKAGAKAPPRSSSASKSS